MIRVVNLVYLLFTFCMKDMLCVHITPDIIKTLLISVLTTEKPFYGIVWFHLLNLFDQLDTLDQLDPLEPFYRFIFSLLKGGNPTAPSSTVTLLRLHSSH